jgi:hypothetical protein
MFIRMFSQLLNKMLFQGFITGYFSSATCGIFKFIIFDKLPNLSDQSGIALEKTRAVLLDRAACC